MNTNDKSCICTGCGLTGAVLGIISAVIVAILFAGGFLTLVTTGIWIALDVGALILAFTFISALTNSCGICRTSGCLRKNIKCLLAGSIGTILFAISTLSVTLEVTSNVIVILIALGAFFLVFAISALVSYLKCLTGTE